MPKIVDERAFNGFERKVGRLGLRALLDEVRLLITGFDLRLYERKHANGAAELREMLDRRFAAAGGWFVRKSGGIDWTKCVSMQSARICIGVELQVSGRSDLLTNDLTHLMQAIEKGEIDVGIIVVPCDATAHFLVDRCPRFSNALDHVERAKAQFSPLVVYGISHDGAGPALPKRKTNTGKG